MQGLEVLTGDIDQAFEKCTSTMAVAAVNFCCDLFLEKQKGEYISVKRTAKPVTRIGRYWGNQFVAFTVGQIRHALIAATSRNLCRVGNLAFEFKGQPIGSIPSAVIVAMCLFHAEHNALSAHAAQAQFCHLSLQGFSQHLLLARFVDDIASASYTVCRHCQLRVVTTLYPLALSITSGFPSPIHIIADVQILVGPGGTIQLMLKNSNREFLLEGTKRANNSIVVWPGTLPCSFGTLRGRCIAVLRRASVVSQEPYFTMVRVIELFWELYVCGYPTSLLWKILMSLPACTEVQSCQRGLSPLFKPKARRLKD